MHIAASSASILRGKLERCYDVLLVHLLQPFNRWRGTLRKLPTKLEGKFALTWFEAWCSLLKAGVTPTLCSEPR